MDANGISATASRRVLLTALSLDVHAMLMALPRLEPRILCVAHLAVQTCLPYGRMTSEAALWMETR